MNALRSIALALCLLAPLSAAAEEALAPEPKPTLTAQERERQELRRSRREARRQARREAMREMHPPPPAAGPGQVPGPPRGPHLGPPHGPPPGPPPTAQELEAERRRLEAEVRLLRQRLEEAGHSEAGRERPTWWDLPSRRSQAMRLRKLRRLRHELDWRLDRLEDLREEEEHRPEREKD